MIGEALVDVVLSDTATPRAHVGGSPLNVAVGVSRLERPVLFAGRHGRDEHGAMIAAHLEGNGVRSILEPDASPTSQATARLDPTGAASYEFDLDWTLPAAETLVRDFRAAAGLLEGYGTGLEPQELDALRTRLEPVDLWIDRRCAS